MKYLYNSHLRNQGGESFSRETFAMSIQLTDLDITQLSLYYKNETDTSTNYYKLYSDANNVKDLGNELILNASELGDIILRISIINKLKN